MPRTRYVLISVFCAITGYSEKAVRMKIENGTWRQGREFKKAPDGHVMIDLDGYERWVEGERAAA